MRHLALLICVLAGAVAWADDFSGRVAAGRAAAATPDGTRYDQSIWPIISQAGRVCDPPGMKVPQAELGPFDLVGNVTNAGRMVDVEVRPANSISECFALQMANSQFATPPPSPWVTYPVLIDLTVTP
jgi:hypothetical protein